MELFVKTSAHVLPLTIHSPELNLLLRLGDVGTVWTNAEGGEGWPATLQELFLHNSQSEISSLDEPHLQSSVPQHTWDNGDVSESVGHSNPKRTIPAFPTVKHNLNPDRKKPQKDLFVPIFKMVTKMETPFLQRATWKRGRAMGRNSSWGDSSWTQKEFFSQWEQSPQESGGFYNIGNF